MIQTAVFPGSFDPLTLGHLDVMIRAAKLFEQLHVLVVYNPKKTPTFSMEERVEMISRSLAELKDSPKNVVVKSWSEGLLVEYCETLPAPVLVKGLRSQTDLSYEIPMAILNRNLASVESIYLLPEPQNSYLSSSMVRQAAALGADVSSYVPAAVVPFCERLQEREDKK